MKSFFTFLFIAVCCFNLSAQNRGLNFDGVDDYVQINNPVRPATFITVEAWFNPSVSSISPNQIMIDQGQYQWSIWNLGGTWAAGSSLYVELYNTVFESAIVTYMLPSSLANTWHHIAFTYDGASMKVYLDGVVVGQAPLTGSLATNTGHFLFLSSGSTYMYKGTLDEVRIWDIARTQAQIQAAMNTEIAGNTAGLVAYYKFNQGIIGGNNTDITTLNDAVATPHNGDLYNFALTGTTSNWVAGYPSLVVLPLRLISFAADKEGNKVSLQWKTAVQKDVSSYEVERSADGRSFFKIGSVSAQRNATGESYYTFKDDQPKPTLNYYRLKAIDDFAKVSYSTTLLIRMNAVARMEVFPNPATSIVQLQTTQKGEFTVLIQDASQRVIKRLQLASNGGVLSTNIDVGNFPKGIYFISVANEQIKFSKQ